MNDVKEGYGIQYYIDDYIYKGEHKNDNVDGYGIIYYPYGDHYEGEFKDGIYNGFGIFYSILGFEYKKCFKPILSTKIMIILYKMILLLYAIFTMLKSNKITFALIIILILSIIIN